MPSVHGKNIFQTNLWPKLLWLSYFTVQKQYWYICGVFWWYSRAEYWYWYSVGVFWLYLGRKKQLLYWWFNIDFHPKMQSKTHQQYMNVFGSKVQSKNASWRFTHTCISVLISHAKQCSYVCVCVCSARSAGKFSTLKIVIGRKK